MSTYVTSVTRNYTSLHSEEVHTSLQQHPVQVAFITIGAAFCFYLTIMLIICIKMYSRHMKRRNIYMKKFRRKIQGNIATADPEGAMKPRATMSQNSPLLDQSNYTSSFQTKKFSDITKTLSSNREDNIPDSRHVPLLHTVTNNSTTGMIFDFNSSEHNGHVELLHTSDECFQNANMKGL